MGLPAGISGPKRRTLKFYAFMASTTYRTA